MAQIFDFIQYEDDCFALALTNKRCWLIGQPRMKALIREHQVSWAGDRIACIGAYGLLKQLPSGLLSSEEQEWLDEHMGAWPYLYAMGPLRHYCGTMLPYRHPMRQSWELYDGEQLTHQDRLVLQHNIRVTYRKPDVLRNITKRQYVRRDALINMTETCPEEWQFNRVDLGHVVLARTCWSTSSDGTHLHDVAHRGVWAGDRFDITSLDALDEKDENGEQVEWKDVTEEVLDEMDRLWSNEFQGSAFQLIPLVVFVHVTILYQGEKQLLVMEH